MSNSEPVAWLSKVLKGSLAGTIGLATRESKLNPELFDGPFPVFRHDVSEEIYRLRTALKEISLIEDRYNCGDWDEIEEARDIANRALGR